jgi:hypothetical protein
LDAIALGMLELDRIGQIDRRRIAMDIDRLESLRGGTGEENRQSRQDGGQ